MTISFVGAQGNTGTTVTIPTHQSGDLILLFAYKDGSSTSITTPTAGGTVPTWISINFGGGSFNSTNFRYAVATGSNTTSGTWTSATEIFCLVYRGTKAIGATAAANNTTNVITYPALTLNRTNSTSWIVGVAGHRSATNVEQAPSGMTNRVSSGTEAAGHDTNGTVSSWSAQTVTVNASSGWRSVTVELLDASLSLSCDSGSYALSGQSTSFNSSRPADRGLFTLIGREASLKRGYRLAADQATFNATLIASDLSVGKSVSADTCSYELTGNDATLSRSASTAYTLNTGAGGYSLSGNTAEAFAARRLAADAQSYAASGIDVALKRNYRLTTITGAFALTDNAVGVLRGIRLPVDAAGVTLAGFNTSLIKGISKFLLASPQSYTANGSDIELAPRRKLSADTSGFVVSGSALSFNYARRLVAAVASTELTPFSIDTRRSLRFPTTRAIYTLTAVNSDLLCERKMTIDYGSYLVTEGAVGLAPVYDRPLVLIF